MSARRASPRDEGRSRDLGRAARVAVLVAVAASTAGCASRELTRLPDPPPGVGTWLSVWLAGVLAAAVLGALVALPTLRGRRGAVGASLWLGFQAGALLVTAAVGIGAAVRSRQLVGRPPEQLPEVALLPLRHIGDAAFSDLILMGVALFVVLPAALLGLGARMAGSEDPSQRWVACGILGLQVVVSVAIGGYLVLDDGSARAVTLPSAATVLGVAALAACWPRPARTFATYS